MAVRAVVRAKQRPSGYWTSIDNQKLFFNSLADKLSIKSMCNGGDNVMLMTVRYVYCAFVIAANLMRSHGGLVWSDIQHGASTWRPHCASNLRRIGFEGPCCCVYENASGF